MPNDGRMDFKNVHTHTYNGMLVIKKEILPFVTWMDLKGIMLSEISQREKYHMISPIYGI